MEKDKWITFLSHRELTEIEIIMSKTSIIIDYKLIRKTMTFVRIGTKSISTYIKATTQFNLRILPPLIKMRQLIHNFLNLISTDILEMVYWSKDEGAYDSEMRNNASSNCSNLHVYHLIIHLFFNLNIPF